VDLLLVAHRRRVLDDPVAIEAEGRESGDAAEMVARADRLWAVARDLGIIDRPPPTMVTN